MSSSTLCYVSASNCESVCGLATVGISWHANCESTTHALSHTQTRTRARTHTHTHKMHNCDKYYLLTPRHLSPTYFPTRSCHYYCPCEQTLTWCLSASLPCMQMPVHVFLCQEMLACPSCMLELTERCDLLSKYLLLYQQGGSWFPPLLSPSLWARKLPSLEVRDNFFFFFWCTLTSHCFWWLCGILKVSFKCACSGMVSPSVTDALIIQNYMGKLRPFGFRALVCDWPLCVWHLHYAKTRGEADLARTNKQAHLHYADLAKLL